MPPQNPGRGSAPDWSATGAAILGSTGVPLLRLMREIFFGRDTSTFDQEVVATAARLGWISKGSNHSWRLTPHGGYVADSAREYCNWLDDIRKLPSRITDADVAGKAVLDIGCGFGRHVFSASHLATLAVGLEAEQAYIKMSSILRSLENITAAEFACGTGERLPFADRVFDLIMCIRALPYMDATLAIPEIARVLRVGGKAHLVVATFQYFIDELFGSAPQPFRIREKLSLIKRMIDSLWLSWTRKPMFRRNSKSTTGTYYLFTNRRLHGIMQSAGLKIIEQCAAEQLFVVERIR